ncbi:MAG: hypothetical protein BWY42_01129 [Candidatus Omnitrophica bacterium ADurb.Bin277]|nr:MAG: hypothetical protein BWY42_01129 [Candidatus Omnitrophica bacterium ADurb.Bin277]
MRKSDYSKAAFFLAVMFFLTNAPAIGLGITYSDEGRRDPFIPLQGRPGDGSSGSSSGYSLEGIVYDPAGQSMALVNGKPYKLGEMIEDAKVTGIRKDHIVILVNEEEKVLWIRESEQLLNQVTEA